MAQLQTESLDERPDASGWAGLDQTVVDAAQADRGLLTTATAHRLGLDRLALTRLVKSGSLIRVCRGLYAIPALVDRSPSAWHLHVAYGASLLYDDATMTGATALLAHGVTVWNTRLDRPALLRPPDRSASASAFWVRPRQCEHVATAWGRAEPVADALVQHTIDNGIAQGVVSTDCALSRRLIDEDRLLAAAEKVRSWPRSGRVRSMLTFVDQAHESPGESLTAVVAGSAGIRLVPQVTIVDDAGAFVARVDFVVEGTSVIVEFDGRLKYDEAPGAVLFDEKKREDRLRSLGYVVVRIIWADLHRNGAVVAKIRAGLELAAALQTA
ncbi:type IV toxin-antitoxin system AbiEi family antitoxin domain-containing protein [Nostocoides sp. F2B08]|uniref:type IV toxin-antitoxin system AbiEi family antitoxin domain-containing protein n=1 Tax=Nostocoides sp. F2B08 TaxID=2653936 RepID=UPI00186ABFD6|nr:type IV toxin-antitoxin system AbiEi family antitoxin domain-containing protein [Tetrasphaera sp. F2B08]